ncbi:hypothetical protein [Sporosarcina gallistercoris]|uniref:Uncharacterized protein n=1 Tax=Sporosarcina gallistercoris TaxID=2762245 RepID=A0ABR8PI99_9BACL|nr:hypothetical protein [Sporosarcina gallistercoris]MBD7907886.1 hypothetical protein [Sporosarcina gallistercoris]
MAFLHFEETSGYQVGMSGLLGETSGYRAGTSGLSGETGGFSDGTSGLLDEMSGYRHGTSGSLSPPPHPSIRSGTEHIYHDWFLVN